MYNTLYSRWLENYQSFSENTKNNRRCIRVFTKRTYLSMSWPSTTVRLGSAFTTSATLISTWLRSTFKVCCKSTRLTRPAIKTTQAYGTYDNYCFIGQSYVTYITVYYSHFHWGFGGICLSLKFRTRLCSSGLKKSPYDYSCWV